jgi:hypothetical protein
MHKYLVFYHYTFIVSTRHPRLPFLPLQIFNYFVFKCAGTTNRAEFPGVLVLMIRSIEFQYHL